MRRIIVPILAALLVAVVASSAGAFENVKFKSTDTGFGVREPVLTGKLYRPAGKGPFPAAVLLHGCGGMTKRDRTWAEKLAGWGIVALAVDSFGPRGYSRVCDNRDLSRYLVPRRVRDAYDAKAYLAGLPFVDPGRIGVMGWSHGGHIVLQTVRERNVSPFKAAIAFYPLCDLTLNGSSLFRVGKFLNLIRVSDRSSFHERHGTSSISVRVGPTVDGGELSF
jgi:dienelactone hydrolase